MQNRKLETVLFSGAGLVIMFIVIVAINAIGGALNFRADLTENNIYTLSEGTKRIVEKLDTPIEIRFYATANESYMPPRYRNYARRVEDFLDEIEDLAGDKIEVVKYNPQPDSDAEDLANLDGVNGQPVDSFGMNRIYLGLAVSMLDTRVSIPFLSPDRQELLEYDVARAISRVANPEKKAIGVISSLPVFGAPMNPMMMQQGQRGQDPWILIGELQRDYDVRDLGTSVDAIDSDIQEVMVIHPKDLPDTTLYALDQFLLRGGRLLVMLDPVSLTDTGGPGNNPMQRAMQANSNLETLLSAWGLSFDSSQVVADMNFASMVRGRSGQPQQQPAVLSLTSEGIKQDDIVTSQIDNLTLFFAGAFTGTPIEGVNEEVLLHSSENSQLVQGFMAQMSGEQIIKEFTSDQKEYALAVRLTGTFKSAFPEGKPESTENDADNTEADGDEASAGESEGESTHLTESAQDGLVLLVGDTDFAYDDFAAQVGQFLGQRIIVPRGGNLAFAQNMVEQLAEDTDLIAVRSRASMERPFTLVGKMQAEAQEKYRGKVEELEEELQRTEQRINELRSMEDRSGQQTILSPQQQAELERFQVKKAETRQELKRVRRDLRREIDALENKVEWINIALMPFVVTLFGIALAMVKRKRTAAK